MEKVKVVVRCIAYNQERYIAQALDGFVMQQTDFKFVVVIHDDASTDRNAEIIKEYTEKYPQIIKPIFETENLYSKHDGALGRVMNKACSQYDPVYIAICEGDDYWIDPYKLQKQVDIMDKNLEYSCCVHEYKEWVENEKRFRPHSLFYLQNFKGRGIVIDLRKYCKKYFCTKTLTALYRRDALDRSKYHLYDIKFDMTMFYALATQGPIYLMNQTMGVYRINDGGVTSDYNRRSFYERVIPRMFSICREERTIYAQEFVYNYIHEYIYYFMRYRQDLFIKCFQYLGLKFNIMLLFYDFPIIILRIIKGKFVNFLSFFHFV